MRSPSSARCHLLVPCAGRGSRSGSSLPKQYVSIAGKAVVAHVLDALTAMVRIDTVTVVVAPDDADFERHVPVSARVALVRCGGATRAASVANGLAALRAAGAAADDWVLVHDAARCLVRVEWVERLIDACGDDAVGGLLALPVADTLKIERDGRVAATLERRATWQAQTPQMFRIELLQRALRAAGDAVTDEAGAVEALGLAPRLIPGALENFKLTWPADFELAERLLKART